MGASKHVGIPITHLLNHLVGKVTMCDINTPIEEKNSLVSEADIVVSATGAIDPFDPNCLNKGSVLIDVGIIWNEEN